MQHDFFNSILQAIGKKEEIVSVSPKGGGCLNEAVVIKTSVAEYFLKHNKFNRADAFEREAQGLQLLRETNAVRIPEVLAVGRHEDIDYLMLEYISPAPRQKKFWTLLGRSLATIHRCTSGSHGLLYDNYIGPLLQKNTPYNSWVNFFIENRLHPQVQLAYEHQGIDLSLLRKMEALYKLLPGMLPEDKPALLHGDLWSGNVMVNEIGEPALIDPAVYYGHREIEIAYTSLFGRFDQEFYDAYEESFPLQPGFDEREELYHLYPLLVHVNLFGGSYASQVKHLVERYV